MSIPLNQFRRDHLWMRFVLLDSSVGPVPSQAKVTYSLTLSLKKSNYAHAEALRLEPISHPICQPALLSKAIRR